MKDEYSPKMKIVSNGLEAEFEFVTQSQHNPIDKNIAELDIDIDQINLKIDDYNLEIDRLTNHADAFDYIIAVASGIFSGLIDSFYVGEVDWHEAKAQAHKTVNKFIEKKAKANGYSGDRLKGAIDFLEKKYKIPSDNIWSGKSFSSAASHHLDDLAHHPTPLGLVANVITTLFRVGIFTNKDG